MKYCVIEEENYIHYADTYLGNDWGFFVELDVQSQKQCVPFKKPRKYLHIPIPQGMETIKEETQLDFMKEELYNNNDDKKKEKTIISQIYSGFAICALAAYICFII